MSASSLLAEPEEYDPSPIYSISTSTHLPTPYKPPSPVSPYPHYPHIPPPQLVLSHEAYSIVKIAVDVDDTIETSTTETTITYVANFPQQTRLKRRDSNVAPHRIYGGPPAGETNTKQEPDQVPPEFQESSRAASPYPSKQKLSVKPLDPRTILSFPAHFGPSAGEADASEQPPIHSEGQASPPHHTRKRSISKPTIGVVTDPVHGDFISYVEPHINNRSGADPNEQKTESPGEQDGIDPLYEHLQRLHNGYMPIQDYGVIGNMSTVALIGMDGSIDFFSYPRFDSPTIFARMLDSKKGGFFQITPTEPSTKKQLYLPNSNVLLTRFLAEGGVGQITDLMPLSSHASSIEANKLPWLLRKVEVVRGEVSFRIDCFPSFDYARVGHTTRIYTMSDEEHTKSCSASEMLDEINGFHGPHLSEKQKRSCAAWTSGKSTVVFTSNSMRTTCTRAGACSASNGIPNGKPGESGNEFAVGGPSTSYPPEKLDFRMSMDLRHVIHAGEQEPPILEWEIPLNHVGACGASGSGPGVSTTVTLSEGQSIFLVLREIPPSNLPPAERHVINPPLRPCLLDTLMEDTIQYWRSWANKCTYRGRWREDVMRSVLALKLMQFLQSGAMVAAPTCSLPEGFGGERNWDYRYTWIRDAAFTVYAFMRIGFTEEASGFMRWIELRCRELATDLERPLQIMYGIDGRHILTEEILSHLDGYRSSRPVRVGNGAYNQLQLDIYGELMDSVYLFNKYGSPIGYDFWIILTKLVEYVCAHWQEKDEGIWEVRGGQQHFVYSKVMAWVAVDRGLRLAEKRSFPAPREKWFRVRDQIYTEIMEKGWSKNLNAFVQAYDNETLDAANLIMPLCFFIGASDPRLFSTLEATMKPPHAGGLVANNLCFRYNVQTSIDGLTGEEGTFSICSFWLVEALTRSGRYHKPHLNQALTMFEQMIGYGNHLGLFGEQLAKTGEGMGNFPQAFTHLALISAAFNLDRVLG